MTQQQKPERYTAQNKPEHQLSPIFILQGRHWSYIQRRYLISPRELEIAQLICRGLTNDQIATNLAISSGTVKTHLRNIYRKIRVKNKLAMLLKFISAANHLVAQSSGQTFALEAEVPVPKHRGSIDTGKSHN